MWLVIIDPIIDWMTSYWYLDYCYYWTIDRSVGYWHWRYYYWTVRQTVGDWQWPIDPLMTQDPVDPLLANCERTQLVTVTQLTPAQLTGSDYCCVDPDPAQLVVDNYYWPGPNWRPASSYWLTQTDPMTQTIDRWYWPRPRPSPDPDSDWLLLLANYYWYCWRTDPMTQRPMTIDSWKPGNWCGQLDRLLMTQWRTMTVEPSWQWP